MPRQGWRGIDHVDGGEDEFVARAGVATLLKVGTFERRARMRRIVAEAEEGQELCEGGFLDQEVEGTNALVRDWLVSTAAVVRWLHACPSGPLAHHGEAGAGATVALACGWASTVAHALASGPLTLEGLRGALAGELPPARLLRYLEEMERFELVEVRREDGGEPRYAATEWLREGVGPILAAAQVERRQSTGNTAAPDALDLGAALRMTLARAELPGGLDGTCRLEVEVGGEAPPVPGRAVVEGLREQIEAHGQQAVEATTDISVSHQIHLWEQDLDVLFEVLEEGVPEVESLAEEMLALWKTWDETLDPDEPYI